MINEIALSLEKHTSRSRRLQKSRSLIEILVASLPI